MAKLTGEQRFLLEWLSKEDSSSLGECHGKSLDALVEQGLAVIGAVAPGMHGHYRRVSLTPAGRAALSASKAKAACIPDDDKVGGQRSSLARHQREASDA
jgi:hypothetical protein